MRRLLGLKRFVQRLISLAIVRPHLIALAATAATSVLVLSGCMLAALSPRAKLDEAVQDMNNSARFGRIDLATEHVFTTARADFLKHHKLWGTDVRIVDVDFGGVEKMADKEATLFVTYSWFRPADGNLHTTVVRQVWTSTGIANSWALTKEERASGDIGLLGEPPVVVLAPEQRTVRFETTRIPGN